MEYIYITVAFFLMQSFLFAQEGDQRTLDQLRGKEYISAREEIIAGKRKLAVTGEDIRSYIAKESVRFRKENPKFNARLNYIETNTSHYPFGRGSFDRLWLYQINTTGKDDHSGFMKSDHEFYKHAPPQQDQIRLIAEALFFEVFPMKTNATLLKGKRGGLRSFINDLGDAVKKDTELTPELKAQIISAVITEYNAANSKDLVLPLKTLHTQVYEIINNIEGKYQPKIVAEILNIRKLPSFYHTEDKASLDEGLSLRKKNYKEDQQLMEFLAEKAVADNRFDIIMPFVKVYEQNFKLILDYDKRLSTNFAEQLLITLKSLNDKAPNDDLAESIEYMTTTISRYTPNSDNIIETEKKLKRK